MPPTLETPDSSRRPSLDSIPRSQGTSPSRGPQQQRRNRAALRDYYNLKGAQSTESPSTPVADDFIVRESELDRPGFDAEKYVRHLLETESLEGLLRKYNQIANGMTFPSQV